MAPAWLHYFAGWNALTSITWLEIVCSALAVQSDSICFESCLAAFLWPPVDSDIAKDLCNRDSASVNRLLLPADRC
jgi:hypothetical protein